MSRFRVRRGVSVLVLVFGALALPPAISPARAEEEDPFALAREEAVVEGAARRVQSLGEAPAVVTVISAAEIARYGWTTLAEVLRSVRGFYVTNDHNYMYAGVRGVGRPSDYNNRLLLMLNGQKVNGPVYEDASVGEDFGLDLRLVRRIEIIRGPISALYGSDAVFGVIHIVTRDPGEQQASSARILAGDHGWAEGSGYAAVPVGTGGGLLVSLRGFRTDGRSLRFPELAGPETPDGLVTGADGERGRSAFVSLRSRNWSLDGFYTGRTKWVPTASYGTLPGSRGTHTFDERAYLQVRRTDQLSPSLGVELRAFGGATHYDGLYEYAPAGSGGAPVQQVDVAEGWEAGLEARVTRALGARHSLQAGGLLELHPRLRQWTYDLEPASEYLRSYTSSRELSAYVQLESHFGTALTATGALRFDATHSSMGVGDVAEWSPHLALVWNAGRAGTIKALGGTSYRQPTPYELYYQPSYFGYAAPELRSERILGLELAWELPVGRGTFVLSGFHNHLQDLVDQEASGDTIFLRNLGVANTNGLEAEWMHPVLGGTARAWICLQRTEDEAGGSLSNSPRATAAIRFTRPWLRERLETAFEYQFASSRLTLLGSTAEPVHLVHLNVTCAPWGGATRFSLGVRNLLGRAYSDPGGPEHREDLLPQYGRVVRVALQTGRE
ncbi:MAG: TonB-dependent receptor [Candidatus Eisenbacteria bacterium]|nr:TonB-dependent receptor [Candidatus Eisenbacteria bacterium]